MRQRIKLAQAIAHEPELLILDEPLSGMDPLMRRRTVRQIKEWARGGTSVLVSSHILHEVEAMTSNIVLINNGRIVAEGDVHQIRDLIDEHPHTVSIRTSQPHAVARELLADEGVVSVRFEPGGLVVERRGPTRSMPASRTWRPAVSSARFARSPRPTTTCRPCSAICWHMTTRAALPPTDIRRRGRSDLQPLARRDVVARRTIFLVLVTGAGVPRHSPASSGQRHRAACASTGCRWTGPSSG
jgi:hypothetical protein